MRYAVVGIGPLAKKRFPTKAAAVDAIRERMLMGAIFGAFVFDTETQSVTTAVTDDANGIMVQPLSANRTWEN